VIGLPTLAGTAYFGWLAADQYAVTTSFIVKGNQAAASDIMGMISGMGGSTSTANDSYAVIDYINSVPMVDKLIKNHLFLDAYGSQKADWFMRLDTSAPLEDMVDYWKQRQTAYFDTVKQAVKLEVRAFTPEDAQSLSAFVLKAADDLVNQLSSKARTDAIEWARKEVEREENRLRKAQKAITAFQEQQNTIDPSAVATGLLGMVLSMESDRSKLAAQIEAIAGRLDAKAPMIMSLRAQLSALDSQIKNYREQIANNGGAPSTTNGSSNRTVVNTALSTQLATFQELQMEADFSQKAYTAALSTLESARSDATRRELYFQTYIEPTLPIKPLYPQRVMDIFLVFLSACAAWVIGSLFVMGVRDHMT
jgi:capsular polysaccharide transport system permease protein